MRFSKRAAGFLFAACAFLPTISAASPTPRANHIVVTMSDGNLLICGGENPVTIGAGGDAGPFLNTCEIFVSTGGFYTKPFPFGPCTNFTFATNVCAAGGNTYSINGASSMTATALPNGKVLIAGGNNLTGALEAAELYDPRTGVWTDLTAAFAAGDANPNGRTDHSATLISNSHTTNDGMVLIAGGRNFGVPPGALKGTLKTTVLFNPANNTFTAGPSMSCDRAHHTAVGLYSGKVFVAGGYSSVTCLGPSGIPTYLPYTETYDPSSNGWVTSAPMISSRAYHAATVLGYNGSNGGSSLNEFVLLAGGMNHLNDSARRNYGFMNTSEIYNPVGNSMQLGPTLKENVAGAVATEDPSSVVSLFDGFGNLNFLQYNGQSFSFDQTRPPALSFIGLSSANITLISTDAYLGHPIIGGAINLSNVSINFNDSNLAGFIKGGILDVSSASVQVTSGTVYFSTIHPELDPYGPLCVDGTTYCPGLRADLSGLVIKDGILSVPTLRFVVPARNFTFAPNPNPNMFSCGGTPAWTPTAANPGCNDAVVATSTAPLYDTSNPDPNGLVSELFAKTLTIITSTVTISSMVFQSEEQYNPNSQPPAWSFTLGKSGNIPPLSNLTSTLEPNGDMLAYGGVNANPALGGGVSNSSAATTFTSNLSWSSGGNMAVSRANHTVTLLPNGNVLIVGGTNGPPTVLNSAELYAPGSNSSTPTGTLHVARDKHTATLLPNGRVLVAGGFAQTATSTGVTTSCEFYDPASALWYPTGSMNVARQNHTATLLANGNVLVTGGDQVTGPILSSAEVYVTTAGIWMALANMPGGGRTLHSANLLQDGSVLVAGGLGPTGVLNTSAILAPDSYAWTAGAAMQNGRYAHTATTLGGNTVMVAGGNNGSGDINSVEIFTPNGQSRPANSALSQGICNTASGCWDLFTSPKAAPSYYHTATLLPNGKVYMTGGESAGAPNALTETDQFDLPSGTVAVQGFLSNPRQFHAAALMPDGSVKVFGGVQGGGTYLSSIESSNPKAGPDGRQPSITSVYPFNADRGAAINVLGQQFLGLNAESSSGYGYANSAAHLPRLILQRFDSGGGTGPQQSDSYLLDLSTFVYYNANNQWTNMDSSFTFNLPVGYQMPYGWYHVRVLSAGNWSASKTLQVAPPAPTGSPASINPTAISTISITWGWTAGNLGGSVNGYEVYLATSIPPVFLSTITPANPTFTQTGLLPNSTAQLMVAGYDLGGISMISTSSVFYTLAAPPGIPVVASVTSDGAELTWSANSNSTSTIYEVTYSTNSFATDVETAAAYGVGLATTSFLVGPLNANTGYTFRVRAFNGSAVASTFSVSATTFTTTSLSGVNGGALSATSIAWSWVPVAGATLYRVYNATPTMLTLIAATTGTSYTDTGLGVNSARQVQVTAVTAGGEGLPTQSQTVFTLANPPVAANPGLVSIGTGSLSAAWFDGGNPPGTNYTFLMTSPSTATVPDPSTSTVRFITLPQLSPNSLYIASIAASNGNGIATAYVGLGSTYTLALPPGPISILGTSPTGIDIAWTANGNPLTTVYQVTLSSNNFLTSVSTPVPFSADNTSLGAALSGLLTGTTYGIQITAENGFGQRTVPTSTSALTFNGGGPVGSIAAAVSPGSSVLLTGTIGSGRTVTVSIPPNTFPNPLTVFVSSRTNIAACGAINAAITITPVPAMQPIAPFSLSLSYSPGELGAANVKQLSIVRYDPVSGQCVPLSTNVDPVNQTLTATVNHLSDFQIMAITPATVIDNARVFPNPLDVSVQGFMTFDRLPAAARIRIYTLHGEELWDSTTNASGIMLWPAKNKNFRSVASGLYIAVIDYGGARKIMKVAVTR